MTNTTTNIERTSVLKSLRSLLPNRVLTYGEALQLAELQAGRLLSLHQIRQAPVPIEIITELPRISVTRDYDLPVSGSALWDGSKWVITLNASEPELRQRFSTCHEFKHILDHPTRHLIHDTSDRTCDEVAERVADFFAACVLMPKAWVKSSFFSRTQSVEALARIFQVSPKAMSVRLSQLGLTERIQRCRTSLSLRQRRSHPPTYFRDRSHSFPRLLPVGVSP